MPIKAVFFDLGGTLLVMRRDRVFKKILLEQGLDLDLEKVHQAYLGVESWWLATYGSRQMTPEQTAEAYRDLDEKVYLALCPESSATRAKEASRVLRARWSEVERSVPLELYPDTVPTLDRLKEDGYAMALVSNAPPDTKEAVDSLGLGYYLDPIVISGLVGFSKPNPEIFRIALQRAGVSPEQTIHIGDLYESDVVGARNAGIKGILLDRDGSQNPADSPKIKGLDEVYNVRTSPAV